MIRSRHELENRKIEIDLNGPEGNAFYLMSYVHMLGKQLDIPEKIRKDIIETMTMSDYDNLIKTFDIWFGDYVILYK